MIKKSIDRWQFGDFQTPDSLAQRVIAVLKRDRTLKPDIIIEPSCGKGAFIRVVLNQFESDRILGFDINKSHLDQARISIAEHPKAGKVTLEMSNFFDTNWKAIISEQPGYLLIVGNPPWVTSSELSILNSQNIPAKSNFKNRRGIEVLTGSGNFDISEFMILEYAEWLSKREGTIAVLCKYSVARKTIKQIRNSSGNYFSSHIYLFNAKTYFGASVNACLLILSTCSNKKTDCEIHQDLESKKSAYSIGERDGWMLRDTATYERWRHLAGNDLRYVWRSGVKHDCSNVMELERSGKGCFQNRLGEQYVLEEDYLYPLLKSSDISNGRTDAYRKLILVTQKSVGEDTAIVQSTAPATWQYLLEHDAYFSKRKSLIYKNRPIYSIFGVGPYTFKRWKIAISGLYKKLRFSLVSPLDGKPVLFDDTVNFLSFDTEEEARFILGLVTSTPSLEFLNSMIFWDEKRPIAIDILRRLSFKAVSKELGLLRHYLSWVE